MTKLNLCSGFEDKKGYVSIDKNPKTKPQVVLDITAERLPYEDKSVDEVLLFHGLEHIKRGKWDFVLGEIARVLKPVEGKLVLGYPEFRVCAANFVNNKDNMRDWWIQTLYGRQLWDGDEHVTCVDSVELQAILESMGFFRVKFAPESKDEYYYSVMIAYKDPAFQHRESLMSSELNLGECVSIKDVVGDR